MRKICSEDKCTGCWACINVCPKECIEMKSKQLYHLYPIINETKCINCGLCKKVCPVLNKLSFNEPIKTYAAWAKDYDEYITSTSGGIASILSKKIIQEKGIVYGCAFLPNYNVSHIGIDELNKLPLLKGSKYVQSNINYIYKEIKSKLNENIKIMFVGTPCQVAGLKSFLRKEYENLLTVDLICHGVPSIGYLKYHIKSKTNISIVDKIKFRDGNGEYILSVFSNGKEIYHANNLWENRYVDEYCNSFIDNYSIRRSCHKCIFSDKKRVSDVTIGDFWGFKGEITEQHNNGLSCILCNTEKGKQQIDDIKADLFIYERELQEAVSGNSRLKKPEKIYYRIRIYHLISNFINMNTAYNICIFDKKKHLHKYILLRKIINIIDRIFNRIL